MEHSTDTLNDHFSEQVGGIKVSRESDLMINMDSVILSHMCLRCICISRVQFFASRFNHFQYESILTNLSIFFCLCTWGSPFMHILGNFVHNSMFLYFVLDIFYFFVLSFTNFLYFLMTLVTIMFILDISMSSLQAWFGLFSAFLVEHDSCNLSYIRHNLLTDGLLTNVLCKSVGVRFCSLTLYLGRTGSRVVSWLSRSPLYYAILKPRFQQRQSKNQGCSSLPINSLKIWLQICSFKVTFKT